MRKRREKVLERAFLACHCQEEGDIAVAEIGL